MTLKEAKAKGVVFKFGDEFTIDNEVRVMTKHSAATYNGEDGANFRSFHEGELINQSQ